jgi:hypothetical protein
MVKKERYNRNNPPPLGDNDVEGWQDYCDWINKEGKYENLPDDVISFPKSFYLISWNDDETPNLNHEEI